MNKTFTITRTLVALILAAGVFVLYASVTGVTSNSGPGGGYTNAPAESNCATSGCHSSYSLNPTQANLSNMTLSTTFTGGGYIPDSTYTLTLSYSQGGIAKYGFQITCLSKNGNNPAGTWTAGAGSQTTSATFAGKTRTYLQHTQGANPGSWSFKWTAPTIPMDTIIFYAVVNATNNNGANTGDEVYAKEFVFPMSSLLPTPSASTSKPRVCVGDTITYYGSATNNPTGYKWRFQSGTPQIVNSATVVRTFNTAGNYRDTFWATNAFGMSKPVVINMQVLQKPSALIIGKSPNDTACQGDTITLTANLGTGLRYQWNTGKAQDTLSTLKVTQSGSYSVTVTNANGCSNTSTGDTIVLIQPSIVTLQDASLNPVCEDDSIILSVNPNFKQFDFYVHNVLAQTSSSNNTFVLKSPGNYSVYAIVDDGFCKSTSNTLIKDIEAKLPAPTLNCGTPTTSSVSFEWNHITGGSGQFYVSLDTGKTWTSVGTDTAYTISGLNFNTKRTLYVKGEKIGPCPDGHAAFLTCTSLPCSNFSYSVNKSDTLVCLGDAVQISVNDIVLPSYSISFNGGPFVTDTVFSFVPVSANGDFMISIVDSAATNCPALDYTDEVIVDTPATMQYLLSDSIICEGEKIALGISAKYFDYTFYKNNIAVQTGNNDIHVYDSLTTGDRIIAGGKNLRCEITTPEFIVTVNQPRAPGFTVSGSNRSFVFTDTTQNISSRTWDAGDNSAPQTTAVINHTYAANGDYTVKLVTTDNNGCVDSAQQQVTANNVGIFHISVTQIRMYPNPANAQLTLQTDNLPQALELRITDINGKLILKTRLNEAKTFINLSDFAAGIYLVHLQHHNHTVSQKLIIQP